MKVTKVELMVDYVFGSSVLFKGSILYVTAPRRRGCSSVEYSDVYDEQGAEVGLISGHWFDLGDKDILKKVDK